MYLPNKSSSKKAFEHTCAAGSKSANVAGRIGIAGQKKWDNDGGSFFLLAILSLVRMYTVTDNDMCKESREEWFDL
jgi:hypothetical protein